MQTVVGIFPSRVAAERAIEHLCALGIARERITCLIPGASADQLEQVPTTETEQPGTAPAIGGVVGGAMGASGSLMTATVASALIPGIGPITAIGILAVGALGLIGGALVGAVAGNALEDALSSGLPKDERFVYEDALRQGRTVLIVLADDTAQTEAAQAILERAGAESLNAAREQWWVGLRDAEAASYTSQGGDFPEDEDLYRRGVEAALRTEVVGKPYAEVTDLLRAQYGAVSEHEAFRRGYERGRVYYEERQARHGAA